MKKIYLIAFLLLVSTFLVISYSFADTNNRKSIKVTATSTIIGSIVSQIGGNLIELHILMPPNTDPHSFELNPRDIRTLNKSDLIFANGLGLEEALLSQLSSENLAPKSIYLAEFIHENDLIKSDAHHDHDEHVRWDPHVWLDPANINIFASHITKILSDEDPTNSQIYTRNYHNLAVILDRLHSYIETKVLSLPPQKRMIITDHNNFPYFARRYEFEIVDTLLESTSTVAEPSASHIAELVDSIRAGQIRTLFVSHTSSNKYARSLASDLNLKITSVNITSVYEGSNYQDMMKNLTDTLIVNLN